MRQKGTYTSCSNTYVHYDFYLPSTMIRQKAIIQIHHGLGEYAKRYEKIAYSLCNDGYIVVVSDFPGHGTSLWNYYQGHFGDGDAVNTLVEDMHHLRSIITRSYPDLPYFMMGNQFGAAIVQLYMAKYPDFIDGAILMGAGNRYKSVKIKGLLHCSMLLHGGLHQSQRVKKGIQKFYNKMVDEPTSSVAFLSHDHHEIEKYESDIHTDFIYTNKGYQSIFKIINTVYRKTSLSKIPNHLAIYIAAGQEDFIGRCGKIPTQIYDNYKKNGIQDIELKLYKNSRHDLLHDQERHCVVSDLLGWLEAHTYM